MPKKSGEQEPEGTEAPPTQAPAGGQVPDGMVLVDKATHDAQGGELRRVKRELDTRKEADEVKDREQRESTAKEAGDFETLKGIETEKRQGLEARLRRAELGDALRDEISGRGFSGEKSNAIKKLVDSESVQYDEDNTPLPASVMAAVDRVLTTYPDMFGTGQQAAEDTEVVQPKPKPKGPSTPPAEAPQLPSDFVSQEEYANTPWEVRRSAEFQERVKRSEHLWPKLVHRSAFQQAPE